MAAHADGRAGVNAANLNKKLITLILKLESIKAKIRPIGHRKSLLLAILLHFCFYHYAAVGKQIYISGGQTRKLLLLPLIYAANSHLSPLY